MSARAGGGSYADAFRPNHTNAVGGSTGGQPEPSDGEAAEPAPPVKHHDDKVKG